MNIKKVKTKQNRNQNAVFKIKLYEKRVNFMYLLYIRQIQVFQ